MDSSSFQIPTGMNFELVKMMVMHNIKCLFSCNTVTVYLCFKCIYVTELINAAFFPDFLCARGAKYDEYRTQYQKQMVYI